MCANKKEQTLLTLGDLLAPPRSAQLLSGTLTGMFTQTHPATHFKTIKQTFFFFWLRWIYKKRSFYLKAAAVWTLKSEKTSTKITFKTFQPHNAVGQWGRGGVRWLAAYNKRLHILWTSKKLLKNATKFGQPK